MKKLIIFTNLLLVIFLLHPYAGMGEKNDSPVPEECKSYISIFGSSNVNQFRFYNENPKVMSASESLTEKNYIHIPVYDFEASNKRMLNDFYNMVNADKYPFIEIAIESREKADFDEVTGMTNFRTKVTIAGKSNNYVVPSDISGCDHRGFILKGELQVKLTDFDIEPPTKLLGAVKVNDEVFIKFAFRIQHEEQLTQQGTE